MARDLHVDSSPQVDFDGPVDLWHFYLLRVCAYGKWCCQYKLTFRVHSQSVGKGAFGKVSNCFSLGMSLPELS